MIMSFYAYHFQLAAQRYHDGRFPTLTTDGVTGQLITSVLIALYASMKYVGCTWPPEVITCVGILTFLTMWLDVLSMCSQVGYPGQRLSSVLSAFMYGIPLFMVVISTKPDVHFHWLIAQATVLNFLCVTCNVGQIAHVKVRNHNFMSFVFVQMALEQTAFSVLWLLGQSFLQSPTIILFYQALWYIFYCMQTAFDFMYCMQAY